MMQVLELCPRFRSRQVQYKEEETAALYVPQKSNAQPSVEVGPSNEAGNVSNYMQEKNIWIDTLQELKMEGYELSTRNF